MSHELPTEDVILGMVNPKPVIEEVLFRKMPMEISPEEELQNEQIKHRNNVLKTFLDFRMMGVRGDKRARDITAVATHGQVTRVAQAEPGQRPNQ